MKTYENKNNLDKLLENVMRFATYFMMVDDYKNDKLELSCAKLSTA